MPLRPRHTIAAAIAAAVFAAPSAAQADCGTAASARPASVSPNAAAQATLCLLNVQRAKHHLRPLRENRKLDRAARGHSHSMVNHKYFAHGDFAGRIHRAGYHGFTLGENIAWGSLRYATPASIVNLWMHSPGHRANILEPRYTEVGIGVTLGAPQKARQRAAVYATDFGGGPLTPAPSS
jgi:uncharacterized protein YkwD